MLRGVRISVNTHSSEFVEHGGFVGREVHSRSEIHMKDHDVADASTIMP